MTRRVDGRCLRLILLHHDESNFVHYVNLLGRKSLRAQNHEVRWCFASRRIGEFMHILLKVLKPEAVDVNLGGVQWLYQLDPRSICSRSCAVTWRPLAWWTKTARACRLDSSTLVPRGPQLREPRCPALPTR